MKTFAPLFFIILYVQIGFSQDIDSCRAVVVQTVKAINAESETAIESHLAADFEMAGHKGEIAKLVASQLIFQLGDTIESYEEASQKFEENKFVLTYSFTYAERGQKNATFVFNEQNLLLKMELFTIQVKVMEDEEASVIKPKNKRISIPFFLVGKLIAVKALLDNVERVFIFDSGSPKVILNNNYTVTGDSLNQKKISSTKGVGGSISGLDINRIGKLDFSGLIMENQEILTLDFSNIEKKQRGIQIGGLIGHELIKDYDLLIDYKSQELILIVPEQYEEYKKQYLFNSKLTVVPFQMTSHLPLVQARIGNNDYTFALDTGAEANLIDVKFFQRVSGELKKIKKNTLSGLDQNSKEVNAGKLKKLFIGGKTLKNTETIFGDISHLNTDDDHKIDGIIGYEVLSKQKTLISFARKEIVFIE